MTWGIGRVYIVPIENKVFLGWNWGHWKPHSGGLWLPERGHNPMAGGGNPLEGGRNPLAGGHDSLAGGRNPRAGGRNPAAGGHNLQGFRLGELERRRFGFEFDNLGGIYGRFLSN